MCPKFLELLYFAHFRMEETLAKLQTSFDDIQQAKPSYEDPEAFLGQHLIRKRSSDQQVSKLNVGLDPKPLISPPIQKAAYLFDRRTTGTGTLKHWLSLCTFSVLWTLSFNRRAHALVGHSIVTSIRVFLTRF